MSRQIKVNGQPQFDHQTIFRDGKTGAITREAHYIMSVGPQGVEYESPPGSGMIYNPRGELLKDGQKEKREAEALRFAAEEAALEAAKKAEKEAYWAEVEKEKSALMAAARAEAEAIKAEAIKAEALETATKPAKSQAQSK